MRIMLLCAAVAAAAPGGLPAPAAAQSIGAVSANLQGRNAAEMERQRLQRRHSNVAVFGDWGWNDAWDFFNDREFESREGSSEALQRLRHRNSPGWLQAMRNCSAERLRWSEGAWRCHK